jgi:hypothetical protein
MKPQEYAPDRRGYRNPAHTQGMAGLCNCSTCYQRRWWTPERRSARAAAMRQQWASGRRDGQPNSNVLRASHWTPEQDAHLRSLAGKHDLPELAALMTTLFHVPRTAQAIHRRCQRLGISRLQLRPYTTSEVARMLGMGITTLRTRIVIPGLLQFVWWRGGSAGTRVYRRDDLERFIRLHPGSYDPARIRDSQLSVLARAVTRGRLRTG